MACRRCRGLMIEECHSDLMLEHSVWRCVNCGAIFDPTMPNPPAPSLALHAPGARHRRAPRPAGTSLR
jgi:rubredoxin